MKSESPNGESSDQPSRWPIRQMLMRGTFGTGTRAEKRLASRSNILFGILLAWALLAKATHLSPSIMRSATLFLPAVVCTFYAWEKRKYFLSLDELPRRIELEGMAWAYSLGVLAALWLGAIGYLVSLRYPLDPSLLSWAPLFLFAMILAAIKGTFRYFATRRY
jgi:TctA family transporter